jgi:hypothetical protein
MLNLLNMFLRGSFCAQFVGDLQIQFCQYCLGIEDQTVCLSLQASPSYLEPAQVEMWGLCSWSMVCIFWLRHGLHLLVKAEELVSNPGFWKVVDPQLPDYVMGVLEALTMRLFGLFYQEEDHFKTVHGRVHQGLLLWDVFCYSLMSTELAARRHKVGVGVASGLVALGEVGDATRGSVLPLLLHVAKATQSQSRQAVLLRARGMQLLVDTIAHGMSTDICAENLPGEESLCNVIKLCKNCICLFISHDNGFIVTCLYLDWFC